MSAKRWQALACLGLLLALGAAWFLGQRHLGEWLRRERLEAWLAALGAWGPAGIVVAEVAQVLLAPVPGQVVGLAAGYLYGAWAGAALCMAGLMIGTLLAVWLARRLGRPFVEHLARPELVARLDAYVERRGALAFLVIFLLPFLPDDICCFLAGLTRLRIGLVLLAALIGRAPGVLVSTLLGAQAHALSWEQWAAIAAASLVLAALFYAYQDRLECAMFAVVDRLVRNKPRLSG
jgi:uncharacterized membrane protein YdjX (TVP38/TMEM64 family)